jgi:peptidyl-prolyl cis-trans isomerase C
MTEQEGRRERGVWWRALRRVWGRLSGAPLVLPAGRRSRYIGASLVALVAVGSIAQIAVAQANALPAGAVFRLGDTVFTQQEYDHRSRVLQMLYGVRAPQGGPALDQYRRATAKAIAVSDILERAKQSQGVVIADKQASDQMDKVLQQNFPVGGRQQFTAALAQAGLSEQDVLEEIKSQLGNSRLFDKITRGVPQATQANARAYYDQHRAQMVQPEQRHLRNIVVDSKEKADLVSARLRAGEDFAAMAGQVSMDSSTKDKGGDLGTVTRQQMEPAYANVAFAAPANGFFGPVQTKQGWHVGQVLGIQPAVPLSFDQLRQQLTDKVTTDRELKVWNSWLGEQIRSADVQYADIYRPKDPDAQPEGGVPR